MADPIFGNGFSAASNGFALHIGAIGSTPYIAGATARVLTLRASGGATEAGGTGEVAATVGGGLFATSYVAVAVAPELVANVTGADGKFAVGGGLRGALTLPMLDLAAGSLIMATGSLGYTTDGMRGTAGFAFTIPDTRLSVGAEYVNQGGNQGAMATLTVPFLF